MPTDDLKFPDTNSRADFWAIVFALIFSLVGVGILAGYEERQAAHYKQERDSYKNNFLEKQVEYEQLRQTNANLTQDLYDANKRLAEAAERERAAKVRASRSRSAGVSKPRVPDQQRVRSSVEPFALQGLRDITMYCPTGNRTASGKIPQRGMVATISRSIPFGTTVRIDGLGSFVVEDRIGRGSEFDIFTPSCAEARSFGRQHRRVTILE